MASAAHAFGGFYPRRSTCWAPALVLMFIAPWTAAQSEFQIVWVLVGEAATADVKGGPRAGRRLFDGADLAEMSLNNIRVSRVDVAPVVSEIDVGQQWCMSALEMRAFGADRSLVPAAPLSITVRQDQRARLQMQRLRRDICVKPSAPGEYPVRLTSLLPALDGSMRGAQIFLRVKGNEGDVQATSPIPADQTAADQ